MAGRIESISAVVPCAGLQYTDLRPTITANTIEEYREQLIEVGKLAGNEAFVKRMSTQLGDLNTTGANQIGNTGIMFNEAEHTYSKNGLPYLSGSTFAHMFEKEFPRDAIAQKVSDKNGNAVEDILAGWDAKGEISLQYGTLIHKCIETFINYGADAKPNNQYLADIVDDWDTVFDDLLGVSGAPERFVYDDVHQLCGVADFVDDTNHVLYDWKTGDIHKKVQHTLGKDFPNDQLSLYTLQLNFYKYIIEQNGGKINKLVIGWLNGEHWEKVDVPIIDIKPYLEQVWKPKKLSSN